MKDKLEALYAEFNRREFVEPDPLQFLYGFDNPGDVEIAGMIASSLAYGRVAQILSSVEKVLSVTGKSPSEYLKHNGRKRFSADLKGFKHRFTTGDDMACLFEGMKRTVDDCGSLGNCFAGYFDGREQTVLPALGKFVEDLSFFFPENRSYLCPSPLNGSACKRLNLFLRWMVRKDDVDPGPWTGIPASCLVVPLDTHMRNISACMGFTDKRQADMKSALRITEAFRDLTPEDPVRYDFALTRLGIRSDLNINEILTRYGLNMAA